MQIYGADFSGAKNPALSLVAGTLADQHLTIDAIYDCDDRLDLFNRLAHSVEREWMCGLDFPFALPQEAHVLLGNVPLDKLALGHTRAEFREILTQKLGRYEAKCTQASLYCRQTDAEANAYSGIKQVNPSLTGMLYSGAKFLRYLRDSGVSQYPMSRRTQRQVCEVYPSHTWAKVGMTRSTDLKTFVARFNALGIIEVTLSSNYDVVATQDIADSVVACITTGAVVYRDGIDQAWHTQPSFAGDAEWAVANHEGLIVRI